MCVIRALFLWLECSFLYFRCIFLWMIRRWGFIEAKSCLQSASSTGPFASTLQFCCHPVSKAVDCRLNPCSASILFINALFCVYILVRVVDIHSYLWFCKPGCYPRQNEDLAGTTGGVVSVVFSAVVLARGWVVFWHPNKCSSTSFGFANRVFSSSGAFPFGRM